MAYKGQEQRFERGAIMDPLLENQPEQELQEPWAMSEEERSDKMRRSLRGCGLSLVEDVHGPRLSGYSSKPSSLGQTLSPYDIVRLAADSDGGAPRELIECPHCKARLPADATLCQWCSKAIE